MSRTRKAVLASSAALVVAGSAAALASGSGHRRAVPPRPGLRSTRVDFAPLAGPPGWPPGPAGVHPFVGPLLGLRATADYLQTPAATLVSDLRSGKTLAQIANSTPGKSASGLVDFLVGKVQAALDQAVKAGRLSADQEKTILSMVRQRVTALVNGTLPVLPAMPRPHIGFAFGLPLKGGLQAAADYLGIPVSTLVKDLRSGKTLADVANATPGKLASGLVDALVAHEEAALDKAVKAGRLTPEQESSIEVGLKAGTTALVNGTFPRPAMPFAPHFRFGPGRDWSGHPEQGGANA
jgi:hypothetical protein